MTTQTIKQLQASQNAWLTMHTAKLWGDYCEIFPKLVKYNPPKIVLNNRLTRTAGRCFQELNVIDLGAKFFNKPMNKKPMLSIILVHEIAHQIDFNLYGLSEKKCGHGEMWCEVMVKLGLPPAKFHSLSI
jgi:predicted SprT family Zn-dependent metalloprotease